MLFLFGYCYKMTNIRGVLIKFSLLSCSNSVQITLCTRWTNWTADYAAPCHIRKLESKYLIHNVFSFKVDFWLSLLCFCGFFNAPCLLDSVIMTALANLSLYGRLVGEWLDVCVITWLILFSAFQTSPYTTVMAHKGATCKRTTSVSFCICMFLDVIYHFQ